MSDNLLVLPSSAGGQVVNIAETAEQATRFLARSGTVFRKGRVLVRRSGDALAPMKTAELQTLLMSKMNVQEWAGSGQNVTLRPSRKIDESTLRAILEGHFAEEIIPNITIIAQRPFLVQSGNSLSILNPGYNPERDGILVLGSDPLPEVDPGEAARSLAALFDDFLFATRSDRSRAIGAVFNAALRMAGIHDRHPLVAFEADDSQAGKTLLWAMQCDILGQKYGTVARKQGGVGSFDEAIMEKLVGGNGFILLDNLRGKVDSQFLEACLTPEGGSIDARVAGVRGIPVDPRPVVFGLTSNAAELTTDLANRTLMIRIRKQPYDYAFRLWTDLSGNEVSVRDHIKSRQPYYHGCVNAIIRDWWQSGAKRCPCQNHSFKQTIGSLDFIVQNYFGLPAILDGHRLALERTTKPSLTWLRQFALKASDLWFVAGWTASRLAERCQIEGIQIPGLATDGDRDAAAKAVGVAMANALGERDRLVIDDVLISRAIERDGQGREKKVYTFTRSAA